MCASPTNSEQPLLNPFSETIRIEFEEALLGFLERQGRSIPFPSPDYERALRDVEAFIDAWEPSCETVGHRWHSYGHNLTPEGDFDLAVCWKCNKKTKTEMP